MVPYVADYAGTVTDHAPSRPATGPGTAPAGDVVTVAHGTRTPAGNEVALTLAATLAGRSGRRVTGAFVELADPLVTDVLAGLAEPAVVVPLLLTTGMHVRQDVPRAGAGARVPVRVGRSLGPHARLATAQVDRLREAGAEPGCPVVLVAAGSSDPLAQRDLARAAELLGRAWGGPARLAVMSGIGPRVDEVVRPGDAVSPYLLAPGFFARKVAEQARAAGATVVADVLGAHPEVVALVGQRAGALEAARRWPAPEGQRKSMSSVPVSSSVGGSTAS